MALGTNRDYKTRDRAARINMSLHMMLMNGHIERGMERLEASKKAFDELLAIPFKERRAIFENRVNARRGDK